MKILAKQERQLDRHRKLAMFDPRSHGLRCLKISGGVLENKNDATCGDVEKIWVLPVRKCSYGPGEQSRYKRHSVGVEHIF